MQELPGTGIGCHGIHGRSVPVCQSKIEAGLFSGNQAGQLDFFVECIDTMGTFWLWEEFHFLNNHELSLWALAWLLHKCCIKDARLEMCKLLK